jgi:type I restriction enzyme M protein
MTDEQKRVLQQQLWAIADLLRGRMNADEFRDYMLGFIFYKYLSEKMEIYANSILAEDKVIFRDLKETNKSDNEYIEAVQTEAIEALGYFLNPNELFFMIAQKGKTEFILDDLIKILNNIENRTLGTDSQDDFDKLFADLDLNASKLGKIPEDRNKIIVEILGKLNNIDFRLQDSESDVLGDAYEYLIGQFASGAGKKAGEFYTPQEVSKILAKLVTTGKTRIKSVYDPTCGSGSLLLRVQKETIVEDFYGQELNRTTYNLARMNMILHDVHYTKFDIKQEDTLERPQHLDRKFEAIVANPPFSAMWSASPIFMTDERFGRFGKLAPTSKADFAFVQHMIYHLADNGQMAVVLPHGVLFRGSSEGHIRKALIENDNVLDAVIGLPANIFYGTSIPTCILVFKKCREDDSHVLFIDASNDFEKAKNQNYLRACDIEKIIDTYRNRTVTHKYSSLVSIKQIAENDYNLNIPRYVDTFEAETHIDLDNIVSEIKAFKQDYAVVDSKIQDFCNQLGIEAPI